jgi:hypothetical protein
MSGRGASVTIFVFGSNLQGIHEAGAARSAARQWEAKQGVGVGPTGDAYALPVKRTPRQAMPLNEIAAHVRDFLEYAKRHPFLTFKVTRIGCGPSGYRDSQIAPLFKNAPDNCTFDPVWVEKYGYRGW